MSWHRDKLHSESHFLPLGEVSSRSKLQPWCCQWPRADSCTVLGWLGLFRLWFIPEQWWQWDPLDGWLSPHPLPGITWICFFFHQVTHTSPVSQGKQLRPLMDPGLQPLCSPQPCSWASVPFSSIKNPQILPQFAGGNRGGVALHKDFIANLIFPMRRKSNYPVFLKEVQIINL